MPLFQSLPGFREFYPEALAKRNAIFNKWRTAAQAFNFSEYDAPILEPLELYKVKSGNEIESQLFNFIDKGNRAVSLRPEMTPTVCRMIAAKANALKRPTKWFNIGEFYRYERAQKGRERSFFQFNCDIFGEPGPEAEIELLSLLIQSLTSFNLTSKDFYVRLSDRTLWVYFLGSLGFTPEQTQYVLSCIDKYEKIGVKAFDAYATSFEPISATTLEQITTLLNVKSLASLEALFLPISNDAILARLNDWKTLLSGLEAMGYKDFLSVDFSVVRGLAYYTGFVFEAFDLKGELRALAGGGRYDNLIEKLGGPSMPAVGFAIGDVTLQLLLEQRNLVTPPLPTTDIFVVIGEAERAVALAFVSQLRKLNYRVDYAIKNTPLNKQLKTAFDSGAKLSLTYASEESLKGISKIRTFSSRSEITVPVSDTISTITKLLSVVS